MEIECNFDWTKLNKSSEASKELHVEYLIGESPYSLVLDVLNQLSFHGYYIANQLIRRIVERVGVCFFVLLI